MQTNIFVYKLINVFTVDSGFVVMPQSAATKNQLPCVPLIRASHAQQNVLLRGTISWHNLQHELLLVHDVRPFNCKLVKHV